MPLRPCLDCGALSQGTRCPVHEAARRTIVNARKQPHRVRRPEYGSAEKTRRARAVEAHRAQHGEWCPGWGVPAHEVIAPNKLSADHVVSVGAGGSEGGALGVLCTVCNGRKSNRE